MIESNRSQRINRGQYRPVGGSERPPTLSLRLVDQWSQWVCSIVQEILHCSLLECRSVYKTVECANWSSAFTFNFDSPTRAVDFGVGDKLVVVGTDPFIGLPSAIHVEHISRDPSEHGQYSSSITKAYGTICLLFTAACLLPQVSGEKLLLMAPDTSSKKAKTSSYEAKKSSRSEVVNNPANRNDMDNENGLVDILDKIILGTNQRNFNIPQLHRLRKCFCTFSIICNVRKVVIKREILLRSLNFLCMFSR